MTMDLDAETLALAQRGDGAAQTLFLRRYAGPLRQMVRRILGSDTEDAMQELFLKLLRVLPRFRPDGKASLTTWVFAVAHRWILEQRRRPRLTVVPLDAAAAVPDPRPGQDREVEARRQVSALEKSVAALPEEQRRVLVLALVHGQPLELIAEVEGLPLGTVKSRLHRARARLILDFGRLALPDTSTEGSAHASC